MASHRKKTLERGEKRKMRLILCFTFEKSAAVPLT